MHLNINKNLKITIITVCFNSEKTIKSTLNSVLNQNFDKIEHIIIDGQSTDRTFQSLKNILMLRNYIRTR